ncbi:MAG TPA: PHP domain-containing protein [Mycobacteriales bacterium]|nr:PHP domain-containing protein [Mycobacteriales bacterium]
MIDLHAHSSASDGTMAPAELVTAARAAGLDVVALTDHDTTSGWDEAAEALPAGLSLVRGAELSCTREGISLHLLGYLFDPAYPPLAQRLAEIRDSRESRAQRMVELLVADGHPLTFDQVRRTARGTVGRPHVAQALIDAGLVRSIEEAFTPEWIGTRGRYWAPKLELDALEAVALVRAAGGVSVFAHAGAASRGRVVGDHVVEELAAAGLDGLEVDHPDHPAETRAHLGELARSLRLLVTGSSDFHGERKSVRLGANVTAEDQYEQLVGRAGGVEVLSRAAA